MLYGLLYLNFRSDPDYESPDDSGGNNVYQVTVKATDNGSPNKSSTRSVTVTVTDVPEPPPPSAPSVSAASSNGHERLSVSWSAPSTSGRPGLSDYDVQYRKSGVPSWSAHSVTGTGTSTTISGLLADTQYYVQVLAKNAEGSSSWSSSGSGRTNVRPNTAPTITSGPTSKSVAENIRSVGSYSATDAESHSISWSLQGTDAGDFSKTVLYGVLSLNFGSAPDYESPDDSGGNNVYQVTVKATDNGSPNKSSTRAVTVTVDDVSEPPDAPSGVSVSAPDNMGHERLSVSWTAPDNSGRPALSGYDVHYCKTNEVFICDGYGIWSSQTVGGTSTLLTGLSSNTGYTVRVRARNAEGTSGWSSRETGSTRSAAAKALAEQMALTGLEGLAALAAPNPFNPSTTLYFQVPEREEVALVVYSLAGQVVKTLIPGRTLTAGIHEVFWEGRDDQGRPVAAGVYFYRLIAGDKALVRKMTLLR